MEMNGSISLHDGEAIFLSYEKTSQVIQVERYIGNITVLRGKFYLLNPGGQIETSVLRYSTIEAGFPSYEQKKNQEIPV